MEDFEVQNASSGEGAVERFVRSLIADNQLSLARNIVESLGEEYNYLKFEIELKAGNFRRALEIFQMLPDAQKKPYVFVAESLEKSSSDVSESMERILRDLYNENYPLALTELQRIKKDHPQVVEAIALELIAAVKRGDKRRAKSLAEVLRKLDKTHPALAQVKAAQELNSLLVPAVLLAVLAVVLINLALSVLSTIRPGGIDTSRIEFNLKTMNTSLETVNQLVSVINSKLASLESSLNEERDSRNATLTDIGAKFKSIEEYMKLISQELSALEKLRSVIQTSSSGGTVRQVVVQGKNVDAELASLKASVGSISSRLNEVLTRLKNASTFAATRGVSSSELEMLKKHQEMLEEINKKLEQLSGTPQQVPLTGVPLPASGQAWGNTATTWVSQKTADAKSEPTLSSAQLESMVVEQRTKLQNALKKIDELSKAIKEINKPAPAEQVDAKVDADKVVEPVRTLSSEELNELRVSVSSLAAKVEELAKLVREQRGDSSEADTLNEAVARLKSEFGREIGSLRETLNSLSQELQRMRANVEEKMAQVSERVQTVRTPAPVSTPEDVMKIIKETKDLRELYAIGLRYFSNGFFEQAEKIFSHLEDRLEGLDVYFAEDVYYFLILTYMRLGKNAAAKQTFDRYRSSYPNGDYVRELQAYLK